MKLDARLKAAADAAGTCALFADIGSDHAKLALHLLETGAAARAVCADIHVAPLERGRQAAARAGLTNRADFVLSDGLDALPARPEVAAICGMGGELIADIVARALRRFAGDPPVRFVLQPMTAAAELRRYLWGSNFAITDERFAVATGRPYVILTAVHGVSPLHMSARRADTFSYADLHLGKLRPQTPAYRAYVRRVCAAAEKRLRGLLATGGDPADELCLLREAGYRL